MCWECGGVQSPLSQTFSQKVSTFSEVQTFCEKVSTFSETFSEKVSSQKPPDFWSLRARVRVVASCVGVGVGVVCGCVHMRVCACVCVCVCVCVCRQLDRIQCSVES